MRELYPRETCRNSPNGWHRPGPPSAAGNLFCIYCGRPLVVGPAEDRRHLPRGISVFLIILGLLALLLLIHG